jgi:hypothetical protein
LAPGPIAERYTSPTLDGQFLAHPVRSYGFLVALAGESGSAALGSPGEALAEAKSVFADSGSRPVRVALLYLGGRSKYQYVTRSGNTLTLATPPRLVWEVWGRDVVPLSDQSHVTDVIGFLDYHSGERIATLEELTHSPQAVPVP